MNKSTVLKSLLSGITSLVLICTPAVAQHGGGHAGGGGGTHAGGGGFHGASSAHTGGYSSGYGGGYHGGFHGGHPGAYGGRGSSAGPHGAFGAGRGGYGTSRTSAVQRPWSWEGHTSRNISPGWHQFNSAGAGNPAHSPASSARSPASATAARPTLTAMNRAPIADGQWHSFAAPRTQVARSTGFTPFSHPGVATSNGVWHGNNWGWHGGHYYWGWGWGCCGWGVGIGWGWGWWGPGWAAWGPFWAWPAYYYNPWVYGSWLYADGPAPYVLDPYPA